MEGLIARATAHGFSHVAPLHVPTLNVHPEVRDMCRVDKCRRYDKNWMCPPACGNLEYHSALLEKYGIGLIVQTTGELDDDFDYEGMQATGKRHTKFFSTFRRELEVDYPNLLALGNGGCGLCEECSYPGVPCRRPSEATQSMEAFGLIVSEVCKRNGIGYYYGSRTITYTGCYLLK